MSTRDPTGGPPPNIHQPYPERRHYGLALLDDALHNALLLADGSPDRAATVLRASVDGTELYRAEAGRVDRVRDAATGVSWQACYYLERPADPRPSAGPRIIDAYLSRKAAQLWKGATVWIEPGERYILERPGETDIGLGVGSGLAGLQALIAAEKQRRGEQR